MQVLLLDPTLAVHTVDIGYTLFGLLVQHAARSSSNHAAQHTRRARHVGSPLKLQPVSGGVLTPSSSLTGSILDPQQS
jgi:hypothetical protein